MAFIELKSDFYLELMTYLKFVVLLQKKPG